MADSLTLQSAIEFQLGNPIGSWTHMVEGLRHFASNDNASGLARGLGMAAIVALTYGDAELGARIAGVTYQLMREKGVMLAPVKVLHLREPRDLAIERLGPERAAQLIDEAATIPINRMVEEVFAAPAPSGSTPLVSTGALPPA